MSSRLNKTYGKTVLVLVLASLLSVSAFAQTEDTVRNEEELHTVLARYEDPEDKDKIVRFIDNVVVDKDTIFELAAGTQVTIILDRYNFQGNGAANFTGVDASLTIHGSSTAFNGGIALHGSLTFSYEGIYMMSGVDRLGGDLGDEVTVNLVEPGSVWRGSIQPVPFITDIDALPEGTIVIGDNGTATMFVTNSNTVRNAETILGGKETGVGTLTLTGGDVDWYTSGSFYVGYEGIGELNILDGITLRTGSITVGVEEGSEGTLNISGRGTTVHLYGRVGDEDMKQEGAGEMHLTGGAFLNLDDMTAPLPYPRPSGYTPKLGLGVGDSIVSNSTIRGSVANQEPAQIRGATAAVGRTTLTFERRALLEGSLEIFDTDTTFRNGTTISPGEGSYGKHVGFGRIDFMNSSFTHESGANMLIDFNVHGDLNFNNVNDHRLTSGAYDDGYLGDEGRDVIKVEGKLATLAGNIYFAPQSGYYSNTTAVRFLETDAEAVIEESVQLHLSPGRWFHEPSLHAETDGVQMRVLRNMTPFTDVADTANLQRVGTALQGIYNAQTNREWLAVLDWMWLMDDDELRRAMQGLAGETRASAFFMTMRAPQKLVFDRMDVNDVARYQRAQRECGLFRSHQPKTAKSGLWASSHYEHLTVDDDGSANEATNSRVGLITGYNWSLSPYSTLGVVFGYSNSQLKQLHSRVEADDFLLGIHYNRLIRDRYELQLWGSYGIQSYGMDRTVPIPGIDGRLRSSYLGNSAALSSQISMPVRWREFGIRPLAAFDWSYVQQNSATEKGHDGLRLHYGNADWAQLHGRIGVKADYQHKRWMMSGSAGYNCLLLGDTSPRVRNRFVAGGQSFEIEGTDLGRGFFSFGVGAQRWLNEQNTRMLFLQYGGEYGKSSSAQTAMLGCQFMF